MIKTFTTVVLVSILTAVIVLGGFGLGMVVGYFEGYQDGLRCSGQKPVSEISQDNGLVHHLVD